MKAQKIGRVLGIGLRIAGGVVRERMAAGAQNAGAQSARTAPAPQTIASTGVRGAAAGRATGSIARGVGGFLRPFRRVGGLVWLEMTGVFFFLFVLVFARGLWRMRDGWAQVENRPKFLVFAALMAVFLYLSASSFWRTRRK
jgi:hypothetical protein